MSQVRYSQFYSTFNIRMLTNINRSKNINLQKTEPYIQFIFGSNCYGWNLWQELVWACSLETYSWINSDFHDTAIFWRCDELPKRSPFLFQSRKAIHQICVIMKRLWKIRQIYSNMSDFFKKRFLKKWLVEFYKKCNVSITTNCFPNSYNRCFQASSKVYIEICKTYPKEKVYENQ